MREPENKVDDLLGLSHMKEYALEPGGKVDNALGTGRQGG